MIKVSYLEQHDATLEFDTEWEWHCVKVVSIWLSQLFSISNPLRNSSVILEQTLQRLPSWLQIRVMPVNNKASVIEKPFIHSPTTNNDLNDEAWSLVNCSQAKGINDESRSCQFESLSKWPSSKLSARKIILFPDHNILGDSQPSVSIVSHGREPGEIAKIRETHG